jgi:hypothetical protein
MKCKCKIELRRVIPLIYGEQTEPMPVIVFCPLHVAAEEMLSVLRTLRTSHAMEDYWSEHLGLQVLTDKAIAHGEGRHE